jgi:hypothetical protein
MDPLKAAAQSARATLTHSALYRDTRGAVALYAAIGGAVLVGSGVLVVDVGRLMVLRAEMQHAADSAVLSAAIHLDGSPGARNRAEDVARNAIAHASGVIDGASNVLTIPAGTNGVKFYSVYVPNGGTQTEATGDNNAKFIRVVLDSQNMTILLGNVLDIATGGSTNTTSQLAWAVAEYMVIGCEVPPLMTCDLPAPNSLADPLNAGKQITIKEGPGNPLDLLPGNFGLLCADGDDLCGAEPIQDNLADPNSGSCQSGALTTAPGSKTVKAATGVNVRFNEGPPNPTNPARDIVEYPEDIGPLPPATLGTGTWQISPSNYWMNAGTPTDTTHTTADPTIFPPGDDGLGLTPSRYQMYLYELGETFYVDDANPANGRQTAYPVSKPGVTTQVRNTLGADIPSDGCPWEPGNQCDKTQAPSPTTFGLTCVDTTAPDGIFVGHPAEATYCRAIRRTFLVAVVDCSTLVDNAGKVQITGLIRYVRFFIIKRVPGPPYANADLHAEVVGLVGIADTGALHANVRLVE